MHKQSSADQRSETNQGQRETRECRGRYDTGYVLEGVAYCPESIELTGEGAAYGRCKGAGEPSHFVYGRIW